MITQALTMVVITELFIFLNLWRLGDYLLGFKWFEKEKGIFLLHGGES